MYLSAPTLSAREELTQKVIAETGATMIHPSNNPWVIAGTSSPLFFVFPSLSSPCVLIALPIPHISLGQGTVALEFLEQVPDLDAIVCPVGGGGLVCLFLSLFFNLLLKN